MKTRDPVAKVFGSRLTRAHSETNPSLPDEPVPQPETPAPQLPDLPVPQPEQPLPQPEHPQHPTPPYDPTQDEPPVPAPVTIPPETGPLLLLGSRE